MHVYSLFSLISGIIFICLIMQLQNGLGKHLSLFCLPRNVQIGIGIHINLVDILISLKCQIFRHYTLIHVSMYNLNMS